MPALVIRNIPYEIPSLEDLHLPEMLNSVINYNNGIIFVTGPTGSGKSTTLASLINTISTNTSISLLLNNGERKKSREKTLILSPIKNKKDASFHLRQSYYQRLIHKNIEYTKSTIKNNTIFIFDWDDTLFFTTHINPSENNTFFYESQTEKKFMNRIEYYVSEILNKALSKGEVFIITNSGDGWVNACAKFYYPNLIPILNKINIISARDLYQKEYPNDPTTWKIIDRQMLRVYNYPKSLTIQVNKMKNPKK